MSTIKSKEKKPRPSSLRRIPHFVAYLPTSGLSEDSSDEAKTPCLSRENSANSAEWEEKQLFNTLLRIRQNRTQRAQLQAQRKYQTSDNLWAAINQSKALVPRDSSLDTGETTPVLQKRRSSTPVVVVRDQTKEQIRRRKNRKELALGHSIGMGSTTSSSSSSKKEKKKTRSENLNERHKKRNSIVEIKLEHDDDDTSLDNINLRTLSSKGDLRLFVNKPKLTRSSKSLLLNIDTSNLNEFTERIRANHSPRGDGFKRLSYRKKSSSMETERRLFAVCMLLRASSILVKALISNDDTTSKIEDGDPIDQFTLNILPMVPAVDTFIDGISPSVIKKVLWRENSINYPIPWNEIDFLGSVYMIGILFLNKETEILDRISGLAYYPKGVNDSEYISNVMPSYKKTLNNSALEEMRSFPLNELISKVYSGNDTSVLVTESGGFYVIGADSIAGLCIGENRKVPWWTGSYYINSFKSHTIVKVACGGGHFAALSKTGDVFTWGANCIISSGNVILSDQLGHSTRNVCSPKKVDIQGFAYDVGCGFDHTVILSTFGVYTFGSDDCGQLGRGTNKTHVVGVIPGSENWRSFQIACGKSFNIILTSKKKLIGWGANEYGQISTELEFIVRKPYLFDNEWDFNTISAGYTHCIGCTNNGNLYGWGSNFVGEIGRDTKCLQNKISQIPINGFVTSVSSSGLTSAAVTSSGDVYVWGLLKSVNFSHNEYIPRMLGGPRQKNLFISNVSCGVTHTFLMADVAATEVLHLFQSACKYESWYKTTKMRLALLSLSDPGRLIKPIQDRAINVLQKKELRKRPFITLENAYHCFNVNQVTDYYQTIKVTNLSSTKVIVKAHIDGLSISDALNYQISVLPNEFILSKNDSLPVNIVLKCLSQPNSDASVLFYFITQPVTNTSSKVSVQEISRYFIMCDIIPSLQSTTIDSLSNTKSHLADVVKSQYENAKNSIKILKTFIPNSLLQRFAENPHIIEEPYYEDLDAAVLFLDVSGFTMLTAEMAKLGDIGPEMISKPLNLYFGAIIDTVERFGGELMKTAGDALLCVFRYQINENEENVSLRDLSIRAIQCGLEIQRSHSSFETEQGHELTLHIGIGAGKISLMYMGGVNNQWMYIVTGEALLQLATCVDNSQAGEIVVSSKCNETVKDIVESIPRNKDYLIKKFKQGIILEVFNLEIPKIPVKSEAVLRSFIHPAVLSSLEHEEKLQIDELRNLTSMFIKLNTSLFNTNSSKEFCNSLQESFICIQENIIEHEGLICQFLQDDKGFIVYAAFGVPPFSHADDPLRAVKAAIDIYNSLSGLGSPCSIGITTGFVFAGIIGSLSQRYYTILGDAVNMAARLMATAYKLNVGVICGQTTYESCNLRLHFDALEPVLVKGKSEPLNIYVPKLTDNEPKKDILPTAFNIIGRNEEKFTIIKYILEMRDYFLLGPCEFQTQQNEQLARTVILEGPAGIGKTFLGQFASRINDQLGGLTAIGYSKATNQITSFYSWRIVLETLYNIDRDSDQFQLLRNLKQIMGVLSGDLFDNAAVLSGVIPELPFSEKDRNSSQNITKEDRHNYITEIITHLIEHKCSQKPLTLVLEDVQWMDAASLHVLNTLVRRLHSALIIITARDLTDSQRRQLHTILSAERTTHLILNPLEDSECIEILLKHLGLNRLPRELRPLVGQVHGNPLYCEELAFSLVNRKILERDASHSLSQIISTFEVPDSVEGLINSRLDLQAPSAQNLLKIASVIGYEFDIGVLSGIYKGKLGTDIKLLQAQNFIQQNSASSFVFRSEIVWRVAYSRLLVYKRKELHQRIAEWYETMPLTEETIQLLAYHWYEALEGQEHIEPDVLDKILEYMKKSADIAVQAFAIDEAALILQKALNFVEQVSDERKDAYIKKLKLQLIGLGTRNLHSFSLRKPDKTMNKFRRFSSTVGEETNEKSAITFQRQSTIAKSGPIDIQATASLQGILKLKSWGIGKTWKSVYCSLGSGLLSIYNKKKGGKVKEEIHLNIASVHVLSVSEFSFIISRRNHSDICLCASSADELKHWVNAISVFAEIPLIYLDIDKYTQIALITTTALGKIDSLNLCAEGLFGCTRAETIGHNIKTLLPEDRLLHKFFKNHVKTIEKKPRPIKFTPKDGKPITLMICVGEYFEQEHKVLISSRPLIELSDEILYVIDADVRAEIDSKKYDIM